MRTGTRIKRSICAAAVCVAFTLAGCQASNENLQQDEPENLYAQNNDIDMFVYEDTAYVNSKDTDWVQKKEFEQGERIGEIKRREITEDFQDWDSTVLPEGTVVYQSDDPTILLADWEGELIPYLKYVEG